MMQSKFNKDSEQTVAFGSISSPWLSTKQLQLSLSKCIPTDLETTVEHLYHVKQSDSVYQEHNSSSSLSSRQSHHDEATLPRTNLNMQDISFRPGLFETHTKKGEACAGPYLSWGNDACADHPIQTPNNYSLACTSNPFAAESYFGSIITAYGPNAVVTQSRVVLPLDYKEGVPVYVNAKQYHAILRRRKIRAKLEVRNKIANSRKPYLHESRHRHALKRARGSGGRFLNTKNTQQAKPSTRMYANDLSLKHISGDTSEPENQYSESNSWGASTPSCSDVSCIFNNNDVFQPHDVGASVYSFPTVHNGARSRGLAPVNGVLLSGGDRCARISTVM